MGKCKLISSLRKYALKYGCSKQETKNFVKTVKKHLQIHFDKKILLYLKVLIELRWPMLRLIQLLLLRRLRLLIIDLI